LLSLPLSLQSAPHEQCVYTSLIIIRFLNTFPCVSPSPLHPPFSPLFSLHLSLQIVHGMASSPSPIHSVFNSSLPPLDESDQFASYCHEEKATCYLVVFVEPILCIIGFFLNVACIIAFLSVSTHSYFRKTSLLFYLVALTFCNALQLLLSIFVIIIPAMEQYIVVVYPNQTDVLHNSAIFTVRYGYPLMMAANYAAIWLLALICAQRFQAICHPQNPWKKRLSCIRRSKMAVGIVAFAACVMNFLRFFELEYNEQGNLDRTAMSGNVYYKIIMEGICYGILVYGIPILILIWLNINTCKLIMNKEIHVSATSRRPAEYRTAMMTVCVFIFFFLCCTLAASLRLFSLVTQTDVQNVDILWLVDVSNLLMNINALVTPILYFLFTRGFRDLFFVIRFAPQRHPSPFGVIEKSPLTTDDDMASPISGV
ncbi:hypothetical protein PMAYCL1PPCAC_18728, partial [Pristionchus mayeri]